MFADLRTKVYNSYDRGLMSLALHPEFAEQPWVYVLYAHDALIGGTAPRLGTPGATDDPCPNPPGATADGCVISGRLSRISAAGGTAGPEQVLMEDWCQQYPSHSVGDLAFGPDGYLYASGGDGASYNWADYGQGGNPRNPCGDPPSGTGGVQTVPTAEGGALRSQDMQTPGDPMTLDGTVIRIDPDTGAGAPGNPAISSGDANMRRVIASGLRNPFRMTFRPGTSELWVGDVGWATWEEINRISNPTDSTIDNFGWPCKENDGPNGYDIGLTLCERILDGVVPTVNPHYAYRHGQASSAATAARRTAVRHVGRRLLPGREVSRGVQRRAVLRGLQPALHLGDVPGSRGRARPVDPDSVPTVDRLPRRPGDRSRRRPLLRRHRRRHVCGASATTRATSPPSRRSPPTRHQGRCR